MSTFDTIRQAATTAEADYADALRRLDAVSAQAAKDAAALADAAALIVDLQAQVAALQPKPKTLIGASNSDVLTSATAVDAALGFQKAFRRFDPPPPKTCDTSRQWCLSWKRDIAQVAAGTWDAELTAWAKALPAGARVDFTIYHEPENDPWTPDQFKAAYRHAVMVVRAAKPAATVRFALIYMGWTLDPASGRDYLAWYPGDDVVDIIGWDLDGADPKAGTYFDFAGQYGAKILTVAKAHGKPWCVPEFGSPRDASDTDGSKRVAWMKTQLAWLTTNGCEYVCLFNYPTSSKPYPLTTTAEVAYWKSISA